MDFFRCCFFVFAGEVLFGIPVTLWKIMIREVTVSLKHVTISGFGNLILKLNK